MTTAEAAKIIGCTVGHVRRLVLSGALKGKKKPSPRGEYFDIDRKDAERYASIEQTIGFPRGQKRIIEHID